MHESTEGGGSLSSGHSVGCDTLTMLSRSEHVLFHNTSIVPLSFLLTYGTCMNARFPSALNFFQYIFQQRLFCIWSPTS